MWLGMILEADEELLMEEEVVEISDDEVDDDDDDDDDVRRDDMHMLVFDANQSRMGQRWRCKKLKMKVREVLGFTTIVVPLVSFLFNLSYYVKVYFKSIMFMFQQFHKCCPCLKFVIYVLRVFLSNILVVVGVGVLTQDIVRAIPSKIVSWALY